MYGWENIRVEENLRIFYEPAYSLFLQKLQTKLEEVQMVWTAFPHLFFFFFFLICLFFLGYSGQRLTSSEMAKGRQQAGRVEANGWDKTQTVIRLWIIRSCIVACYTYSMVIIWYLQQKGKVESSLKKTSSCWLSKSACLFHSK